LKWMAKKESKNKQTIDYTVKEKLTKLSSENE
jgi:hypothetical protein